MTALTNRERRITPVVRRLLAAEIREHAEQLLLVDGVLTDAQLARQGLSGNGFPSLTLTIRPMPRGTQEVDVTFRALSSTQLRMGPGTLTHAAGTAAIRHLVQAKGADWQTDQGGPWHRPDAVWRGPEGDIGAEYDAGYTYQVARKKVAAFAEFRQVIWGTPSALRATRLRAEFPELDVRVVDYWTSQT